MVHKPYFQEAVLLSFLRRCHSVWSHIIQIFLSQMFDVVFELPVASVLFFRTVPRFFQIAERHKLALRCPKRFFSIKNYK